MSLDFDQFWHELSAAGANLYDQAIGSALDDGRAVAYLSITLALPA